MPVEKPATDESGWRTTFFPDGEIFSPPLAAPKEVRSQVMYERVHIDAGTFNLSSVAFGDGIGLVRWGDEEEAAAVQVGLSGVVLAQFNLDTDSFDLVNADYIIGIPVTARLDDFSGRLRFYHQSSHLGDEFLLGGGGEQAPESRINLSFETLELLGAYEWRGFELYGGPSRIVHTSTPLEPNKIEAGLNYRSGPIGFGSAIVVGGIDYSAWQQTDWDSDVSVKFGLELNPQASRRTIRLLLEYYRGHLPYGQFFEIEGESFGIGFTLNF